MFHNLSALNENSKGRLFPIDEDHRLPYERDRDRIYHSTAFRKLKDKTQVFMFEKGDYYRNRLTHTLEVSQIARSVSRRFSLNEDLAECIALCHDLGHSPFGHVGEDIISQEIDQNFNHNFQSYRQVTLLEKKYISYEGLNLTWETLDGLIKHNGKIVETSFNYDLSDNFSFNLNNNPSLEAQIASLSDDIAYIAHDFDDGIRAEILDIKKIANLSDLFDFIDFDYIERPGSDVIRFIYTGDNLSSFELVYLPSERKGYSLAGLYKLNSFGYDFQILAANYFEDIVIGGGWAGNIKNAGFKGIAGVPCFIVNNTYALQGAQTTELWLKVIDEVLEHKKK